MKNPHTITETKSRKLSRLICFAAIAQVALPNATIAQNATPPSYLPPNGEVVQLEKLLVSGQSDTISYDTQRSVSSTKTDTALVDVPQAITVVTRELIDDQAMRGIGDLTRYVPGVGIAQGEGNRDTPVLRGNSTTADFFVDGMRDDVQYFRDLYNVDRVEVLKGPNAMIFGRGGSGGLINRITKLAGGAARRELTLQAGSWDQFRATFDLGQPLTQSLSLRVTGLAETSGSYRDAVTLKRQGVNPTLAWRLAARTTLSAGYEHFHDDRVADRGISSFQGRPVQTAASTFFGDPARSQSKATVNTLFAVLDHRFANGVTLRNSTRFSRYEKTYQNVYPGAVNVSGTSVAISAYRNATDRDNLFNQTDVVVPFETGPLKHQLLTGMELARQETDNLRKTGYFTTISPTTTSVLVPLSNPRTTLPLAFLPSPTDANNHGVAKTVAVYVQDQVTILPQLQAIVGVRWEKFAVDFLDRRTALPIDNTDDRLSPRAGLVYKPAEPISIYASYSLAFVPRAGEQLSSLTVTNRALEPENFKNYEIGLKWDLRSDLAFTAATYRLDRHNVAVTDPTDPAKSVLVDGQRATGVELGVTGRITRNWSMAGGYAYQDGRISTTQSATVVAGARLAQLPRHTFSLWNRVELNPQWGLGAGVIYRDELYAAADDTVTLPGFVRFDAALFYRYNKHLRAQLNVENIFNRAYYATANSNTNITPGSPRALRISMTTTF